MCELRERVAAAVYSVMRTDNTPWEDLRTVDDLAEEYYEIADTVVAAIEPDIDTQVAEVERLRREHDVLGLAIEEARNADPSLEGIPSFGEAIEILEGGDVKQDVYGPIICDICGKDTALSECAKCSQIWGDDDELA